MAVLIIDLSMVFIVGVLGNLISFMVFLSPVPTFRKIYRIKSTEGFQSVPYVLSLFSCMLWTYYALLKHNEVMLVTVNTVGCVIESFYIAAYLFYAPKRAKIFTMKTLLLLNVGGFALILLVTRILKEGPKRVEILGWFCVAFTMCVFAAPLCVIRKVIRTKSIEYMPFSLSFFLTLCAIVWFFYGLLKKDICIALPNVLGFFLGVLQMVLYAVYKNRNASPVRQLIPQILPEHIIEVVKLNETLHKATDLAIPILKDLAEAVDVEQAEQSLKMAQVKLP